MDTLPIVDLLQTIVIMMRMVINYMDGDHDVDYDLTLRVADIATCVSLIFELFSLRSLCWNFLGAVYCRLELDMKIEI